MRKIFIILILVKICYCLNGQTFSFKLYFEDDLGYKNSLVFGYDEYATDTIDELFGEDNLISIPFDTIFETRISDYDFSSSGQYIIDPTTFQTKIQIKREDCSSDDFPLVSVINISRVTYPLKVYWDSSLFSDTCRQKSLITDWHPGGWFDAVYGGEQGPFYLNSSDTVIFTHTTSHYISTSNDTIDVIFITLASANNFIAGLPEYQDQVLNICPNPVKDLLTIQLKNPAFIISSAQLFDFTGKYFPIRHTNNMIDFSDIANGIYLLRINFENGRFIIKKVVKYN